MTWTLDLVGLGRPPTVNAVGRSHWAVKAKIAEAWKAAAWKAATQAKLPRLESAVVTVQAHYRNGVLTDADACALPAKGAVDGLVAAGVLEDDGPTDLLALVYLAPIKDPTRDHGLELQVLEAADLATSLELLQVWADPRSSEYVHLARWTP